MLNVDDEEMAEQRKDFPKLIAKSTPVLPDQGEVDEHYFSTCSSQHNGTANSSPFYFAKSGSQKKVGNHVREHDIVGDMHSAEPGAHDASKAENWSNYETALPQATPWATPMSF